jgi:tetratricopeptide (TPR) repeat protein
MPSRLLVERALALVPDAEEFLPLTDAVIGSSKADREKVWARSSAYATLGKRVVDARELDALIPQIAERAQRRLQELFKLILAAIREQEAGNLAAAAAMLIHAGELEEGERRLDKAEKIYKMALEIARDLREKEPHILVLRRLGRVTRTAGRLKEAWEWYEQSYQLSMDQLDLAGQVIACQGLGNLCDDRGQRDLSRAWYQRGLTLARGLDNPKLLWPFYTNLAVVARKNDELDKAEALLAEAHMLIAAAEDEAGMFFWYNGKGLILLERGDPAGAEEIYRQALEQSADPFWEMTIRVNLGQTLVKQGRLFEAEEEARCAEELAILNRFVPDLVDVYDLLGTIARCRCDEEGFVFYEQALEVCHEREMPQKTEAAIYHGYGLLHQVCGRRSEAIAYLDQAREIYSSLGLAPELSRVLRDMEDVPPALSA